MEQKQIGFPRREYIRAIETGLCEKYGLKFQVESFGGAYGNSDETAFSAWCFCEEGKYAKRMFLTKVNKENMKVTDTYLSFTVGDAVGKIIQGMLPDSMGTIFCQADMDYLPSGEVLELEKLCYGSKTICAYVFVPEKMTADEVWTFAKKMEKIKSQHILVVIFFVDDLAFDYYGMCAKTLDDRRFDTLLACSHVKNNCTVSLCDGKVMSTVEQIQRKIGE